MVVIDEWHDVEYNNEREKNSIFLQMGRKHGIRKEIRMKQEEINILKGEIEEKRKLLEDPKQ